jgi:hypothetical protein
VARAITKCPNCGEPVTQFAAGCSICGEDLQAARARLAARKAPLTGVSSPFRIPVLDDDAIRVGLALVLTLFVPLLGLLLSGWFAWQAHSQGHLGTRNLLVAVAVLAAVIVAFAPVGVWWLVLR